MAEGHRSTRLSPGDTGSSHICRGKARPLTRRSELHRLVDEVRHELWQLVVIFVGDFGANVTRID